MEASDVLNMGQQSIWVIFKIAAPVLLTALVVGLLVSFIQALTQIQEMTLSFIPKIISIFTVLLFSMSFIGQSMHIFAVEIFHKIAGIS